MKGFFEGLRLLLFLASSGEGCCSCFSFCLHGNTAKKAAERAVLACGLPSLLFLLMLAWGKLSNLGFGEVGRGQSLWDPM